MIVSIQLHTAEMRETPQGERLSTNTTWISLDFGHTSASVPKAQNGQRHNSDMLFQLSEKLKVKANLPIMSPILYSFQQSLHRQIPFVLATGKAKNSVRRKFIFYVLTFQLTKLRM